MTNNKLKNLNNVEGIEILFGWFLLAVAAFLHLTDNMAMNEKIVIIIPALLGVALFKILFDSVSGKLIQTENILHRNLLSLIFAVAVVAGTIFLILSRSVQLPQFISARFTMICSVVYTCIIYFSGRKNNIMRYRFYGYLTLILIIILNFRNGEPINRAIVLLVTVGFSNLILAILSILKSVKE